MQALHGQTVVIVDGGAASDAPARQAFAQDVALLALTGVRPIVVQGVPAAAGTQSIHAVHAAMAGVNHELVRLIGSHGAKAIGIDGHDGGLLVASADSDRVGTSAVARFDGTALNAFLENGLVPVVMPVAPDDAGHDHLLRAERLGSLFAQRTGAVTLVMMVDGTLLRERRTRGAVRHHGTRALARRAPGRRGGAACGTRSMRSRTACRTSISPTSGNPNR